MPDRVHELLNYWFGNLGSADLPSSDRTNLWFGENEVVKRHLVRVFTKEYELATTGNLKEWEETPRGCLALIILLDQFPRYLYKGSSKAFSMDEKAQLLCAEGLREKMDHSLTTCTGDALIQPRDSQEKNVRKEMSSTCVQQVVRCRTPRMNWRASSVECLSHWVFLLKT